MNDNGWAQASLGDDLALAGPMTDTAFWAVKAQACCGYAADAADRGEFDAVEQLLWRAAEHLARAAAAARKECGE